MFRNVLGLLVIAMGFAAVWAPAGTFAQSPKAADGWSRSTEGHRRKLSYSSTVKVLGQDTQLDATFYCSTERTKMLTGAIGFDVELQHPDTLKPFHFDDFEGPDAPAQKRQLLTATIVRAGGAQPRFQASAAGSYSVRDGFVFEVSEVFYRKGSAARRVLEELGTEASALALVITDYRTSSTRIELTIPVTGRSADFRWLLEGLQ